MGYAFYTCALAWGITGNSLGWRTDEGFSALTIAAIFFVGGAIVFAINDTVKPRP